MKSGKERKKERSKERKRETSNTNSNSKYLSASISALAVLAMTNFTLLVFSISFSRRLAPYFSNSSTIPISLMNSHQGTKTQIPQGMARPKNNYNNKKFGASSRKGRLAPRPLGDFEPSCLSGKNSSTKPNREDPMTELQLRNIMTRKGLSINEGPEFQRIAQLEKAVAIVIPPRNQSDRTCLKKMKEWLLKKNAEDDLMLDELLRRIIDYALEASGPRVKNPPAVFIINLKK
jgi:hypothetical protein